MSLPKRPHGPADEQAYIDHEHAVARLAVEALEQIEREDDRFLQLVTDVLNEIEESGWIK